MARLDISIVKLTRRCVPSLLLVFVFGQYLSCYSPAMSHYKKAQNAEQKQDNTTAETEYLAALQESPDDPAVVFALANLYVKMDNQDKAIEQFNRFLEITATNEYDWSKERWDANFYIEKANQQKEDSSKKKKKKKDEDSEW